MLPRQDQGLLGLRVASRPLACDFRPLHRAPDLDLALLLQARRLALALDVEGLPLRLEVARADQYYRFLLDVVTQLPPVLDLPDDPGQALRVKAVGRVEE